jgi:Iron-containing redox enzyme
MGITIREGEGLRRKLSIVLPELAGVTQRFLASSRISDLYPEYLFSCYCIARASVLLMQTARERALSLGNEDPVGAALAPYLEGHVVEEMGHDQWFLEDLGVLGWDRSAILTRPPSATIASMVGAQYYWVLHYHPVALLGFLTALESNPPSRSLIDELISKTGHTPKAFRTLIEHADLDPHHEEELYQLLDDLLLTREQSAVLGLSAIHTLHMTAVSLEEIVEQFEEPPGQP